MRVNSYIPFTCAVALVAAASAHAQSSVTVYGIADSGIEHSRSGTSLTRVISGGGAGSRIGFRGTEDLGGGLSAIFRLEQGINIDNGTLGQSGRAFGREASVGISSQQWGTVQAGRLPGPYYSVLSAMDAFGFVGAGGMLAVTRTGSGGQQLLPLGVEARNDNSIGYISPTWSGFEVRGLYTVDEKAAGTIGKGYGASVRYAAAPIDFAMGYTRNEAPVGGTGDIVGSVLGGSYDFKVAKIFAGVARERNSCSTCTGNFARMGGITGPNGSDFLRASIGARVPLGAFTAVAQVARIKDRSTYVVNSGSRDATWFALGTEYALSRRTLLHASVGTIDNQNGSLYALGTGSVQQTAGRVGPGNPRTTTVAMGIRHSF